MITRLLPLFQIIFAAHEAAHEVGTPFGFAGGACETMSTDESLYCSKYIQGEVFQFAGNTFEGTNQDLSALFTLVGSSLAAITTADCVLLAEQAYCHLYHPACTVAGTPRRLCKESIAWFLSSESGCDGTWTQVIEFGLGKNIPDPTNIVNDGTNDAYKNHLASWAEGPAFPDGWYTEPFTGERVPCLNPWQVRPPAY